MKLQNLNPYSLSALVDLSLDREKITIVCSQHYSTNHININPIIIIKDDTYYQVKENIKTISYSPNFREKYEEKRELLNQRFLDNELFKVVSFMINQKDLGETPFFAFGNNTTRFTHEILEIYKGSFDLKHDYFIPDRNEIHSLLTNRDDVGQSSYFYVNSAEKIWGPFNFKRTDGQKVKLTAIHHNENRFIFSWDAKQVENLFVEFETLTPNNTYIKRSIVSNWLPTEEGQKITFLPNDELLNYIFKETKKLREFPKAEIAIFKKIHTVFSSSDSIDIDKSIYSRVQRILEKSKDCQEFLENFLDMLPETEAIKTLIANLEEKKTLVNDELSNLKNQSNELKHDLDQLDKEKLEKKRDLNDIKNEYERLKNDELESTRKENEHLKKVLEEKANLQKKLERLKKFEKIEELEKEISDKEAEIRVQQRRERELNDTMTSLRQEFIETQKEANEKLKELVKTKTYFDFISGRDFENLSDVKKQFTSEVDKTTYYDKKLDSDDGTNYLSHERMLLGEINKKFKEEGRDFTSAFVANLLISIHQNTFTIFAGIPGAGKTSLARLISSILVKDNDKLVEVSVAKGWTSPKDLIGFYNPLSKSFCPADKKIYNLLNLLNQETEELVFLDSALAYVILDEANLSPIEHYWSNFYNMTDSVTSENKLLSIDLGGELSISYPNNLRFIGTINSDQTTEELSPRIIDRVNIIRIPKLQDVIYLAKTNMEPEPINTTGLTFKDIIKMFHLRDFNEDYNSQLNLFIQKESYLDIKDKYIKLKNKFEKLNINISPRTDIAFINYCMTAFNFMSPYRALDYFISQRVLTKIDGYGEKYRDALKELQQDIHEMLTEQRIDEIESCKIIQEIIHYGSNEGLYDNYNYFLIN